MTYPFSGGMVLGTAVLQLITDQREYEKGLREAERKAEAAAKRAEADAKKMADNAASLGGKISLALGGASLAAFGLATKAAIDYESAFAGVRKTVDGTPAELQAISDGLRGMAREIPVNATGLAGIAEAAGQLGIEKSNILGFTRTMADLGVATNLTGEQAAVTFAQFANITKMSQGDFDRLGSTVVALGNNLATTESQIAEFGLRIAGAGQIAGLAEAEILSIGGAMASVGVEAEAGGTAVQKVLLDITNEVATGGDKLEIYAKTAGMSAQQFADAWRSDPGAAFTAFVEGLGTAGDQAFTILDELDLKDQRLIRSFLSLAGAGDLLRNSMELGNTAWEENTALATEAEQRYATTASQLAILKNNLTDIGITFGSAVTPALAEGSEHLSALIGLFGQLPESTQQVLLLSLAVGGMAPMLLTMTARMNAAVTAAGGLRAVLTSGRVGALGFAAGLTAIAVAADLILTKTTGDGLMAHLMGKADDNRRAREAAELIERINRAWGDNTEKKIEAYTEQLHRNADAWEEVKRAIEEGPQSFEEATKGMFAQNNELKQHEANIRAIAQAMDEAGVSVGTMMEFYRELPPALQEVFDAETGVVQAYNDRAVAEERMRLQMELSRREQEETIPVVSELHSKSNEFMRAMQGWEPVLRSIADATGITFDEWKGKIPPTIASMDDLSEYLETEFSPDVAEAFDTMREGVQESFDGIKGVYESILPETDETFAEWKKRIDKMVEDHLAFKGNLQTIYGEITAAGVASPEAMISALAEQGPAYVANFEQWFAKDPEAALEGLKAVAPILMGQSVDGIINEVIGGAPEMDVAWNALVKKPADEAVEEAKRIMREEGPLIVAGLAGALTAPEQIGAVTSAGYTVGKASTDGVAAGVEDPAATANLRAAITRVKDNILNPFLELLGILSPSRVMRDEVGIPISEGIAVGILAGQPAVVAAAQSVVAAATAKAQADMAAATAAMASAAAAAVPKSGFAPGSPVPAQGGPFYLGADGQWHPAGSNAPGANALGGDGVTGLGLDWQQRLLGQWRNAQLDTGNPEVGVVDYLDIQGLISGLRQNWIDPSLLTEEELAAVRGQFARFGDDYSSGSWQIDQILRGGVTVNNYGTVNTNDLDGTMGDIGFGLMDELGRRGLT